jgi:hypothetical protein
MMPECAGHWADDVRCGRGTMFYVDKGTRFDGEWRGDRPRAGQYSALEQTAVVAAGALPVLELADCKAVLQSAMCA